MNSVLTLISDGTPGVLNNDTIAMIRDALESHRARLGETDWLAEGRLVISRSTAWHAPKSTG